MTLEDIEAILFEELSYSERLDQIEGEEKAGKLIYASHLRSQIGMLTEVLHDESNEDTVDLLYKKRNEINEQLTKLNQ